VRFSLLSPGNSKVLSQLCFLAGVFAELTQDVYSVFEDGRDVSVCVILTGALVPTESAIWINLVTQNGTAIGKELVEGPQSLAMMALNLLSLRLSACGKVN
jgi:hypothetical protein